MGLWLVIHAGFVLKIARQKYTLHSVVPRIEEEIYSRKQKSPLCGLFNTFIVACMQNAAGIFLPQHSAGNNNLLHLARSFVNLGDFGVTHQTLYVILLHITISTVNLNGFYGVFHCN
jgi:hypothetical protein